MFHGSENTGWEATVYQRGNDPLLRSARGAIPFDGGFNRAIEGPSIVSVSTQKRLGEDSGTFSIDVKVPRASALDDRIIDDAWIDLLAVVNGRRMHVMRGLVKNIRESVSASTSGVARTFTLSGTDHGSVFTATPIWFNVFRAENAGYAETLRVFGAQGFSGPPDVTVQKLLYGFMESMASKKRVNWLLPESMPGRAESFPETVLFNSSYINEPPRFAVSMQFMQPAGVSLWSLAKEWSDPAFCELFCDLVPATGGPFNPHGEYGVLDTRMAVNFRQRPFPYLAEIEGPGAAWAALPTHDFDFTELTPSLGRGGSERFNAFFVAPQVLQSYTGGLDLTGPLWDTADMETHGMRQFNVESRYVCENNQVFTMARSLRERCRDWYALNPYLLSGTITSGKLLPEVRIGDRLRVRGPGASEKNFYVEQVSHQWSPGNGRTTLGVTRGWDGDDASYLSALRQIVARYSTLSTSGA